MLRSAHIRVLKSLSALSLYPISAKSGSQEKPESSHEADAVLITDKFRELRNDYQPPKHPIVLCHGLSGFDTMSLLQFPQVKMFIGDKNPETDLQTVSDESNSNSLLMVNYWHGIEDALTKTGAHVITAKVPPFGTIADRAVSLDAVLKEKLKDFPKNTKDGRIKVNMVGHSMGGLDSRYLISKLQNQDSPYKVVSLVTISTPHRGSEVADFVMSYVENDQVLSTLCPQAIPQLTTDYMKEFNVTVGDDPTVAYFSYGARMRPNGIRLFRATFEILKHEILRKGGNPIDNDGMVSVESSKWGKYIGTLDDVDHLDLINWTNKMKATMNQAMFQKPPSFNPIALYLDIADTLSRYGF